jgi:hypothetical protein
MLRIPAIARESEGPTVSKARRDSPHDARTSVAYLLLSAFVFAICRANRSKPRVRGRHR